MDQNQDNKDTKKEILEWIKSILLAIVIAVLIKTFIFNTTYVLGNSMYPTLHEKIGYLQIKYLYIFQDQIEEKL